ncbi:MAG TPA: ROK family protein [Thermoanaerobaculia bacterium]|nr:ROK family protein [Thermoanaerobaculia bacterium]
MPTSDSKATTRPSRPTRKSAPRTLAIDIGGTGLKATVLDAKGAMVAEHLRVETPHPAPPEVMVAALVDLVKPLPKYDRVSVGFPGVVREGQVLTAPHFGNDLWRDFPLGEELRSRLGKPVRVLNDADVQGYGAVRGRGIEFVITLGTGLGTALFSDGELAPHMEFAQFPFGKHPTFNAYVGDAARKRIGKREWNRRVEKVIGAFRTLLNFDQMYVGGGNSRHVTIELPDDVHLVSNEDGLTGGVKLWS